MSAYSLRSLFFVSLLCNFLLSSTLNGQQSVTVKVTQAVDNSSRVTLPGNTYELARREFDKGEAPADLPMKRMLLVLKRSLEQQSALGQLLDGQQDKHSPSYHRWVTPQEFGAKFGPADSDVAAVSNWLKSSGFEVAPVNAGRTVIEFSGTASQVKAAFQTPIHKFVVNGKEHWANASDPQIPAALAPVVAGVGTMHNFLKQPQIAQMKKVNATFTKTPAPQVTFPGNPAVHALGPADYATIYNINPAYNAGINGTGQTIAIVARSEFRSTDLSDFRNDFGLSFNFPQVINNGDLPGILTSGEEAEAILDVTWSSAIAPGATIDFVVSASTNTTDGVDLSELYIVDHNLADVMTESFGSCEAAHTNSEAAMVSALAEQAAAQGITYVVSTGDSGAEGCDRPSSPSATGPVSASLLSGTPFNVAVGGTMFNEGSNPSKYWGASAPLTETALSYIPENVWNESCASAQCGASANLSAGGGGASTFFAKPSWQSGVKGIPSDGMRDQPDVSLTAANHDPYLVCFQGSCGQGFIFFFSGTSAAAPSFAGIMAMVDQKMGARQGQANYVLYRLAAADIAAGRACNASGSTPPASTCNFYDVTAGNNAVPGETGYGTTSAKYQSATGYDLATGLGSVNVNNLVNNWGTVTFTPTTTTLALSPTTLTHGASASVNIAVAPSSGTGVPTGDVSLRNADVPLSGSGLIDAFTLSSGSVAATTNLLPGGAYHVVAHYAGDKTFAASDSASPIAVTVNPEGSTTALGVFGVDASGNLFPYGTEPYGSPAYLRADVAPSSGHGTPSGFITYVDNSGGGSFLSSTLNSEGTGATPQGYFTLPAGTHSVVAQYNGDNSFTAGNSPPVAVTVTKAATANVLTASNAAVAEGTIVSLTTNLGTSSFGVAPSGLVTFLSNGAPINNPNNPSLLNGTSGSGNLQTGSFTTAVASGAFSSALPVGTNAITVQYNGDQNYTASTSSAVNVTVVADFDFAIAGSPLSVTRGTPGTVTLTVTGHTGYNSTVNFSANSCTGLPAETTCTFNPASLVGSGSSTLTIRTTAPTKASLNPLPGWITGSAGISAALFLLGTGSRRRRRQLLGVLLFSCLAVSLIALASCGGGGGSSGPPPDPGTPVGMYNVTVHAADSTGVIAHTSVVSLTVN